MTTRTNTLTRLATAVAAVAAATVLAAVVASRVSADPPPAAAGNISHGFLVDRGVVTTIDHPKATTIPATQDAQAGTATIGINDRGDVLGVYEGRRDRIVRDFLRDRKGRYQTLTLPRAEARTSTWTSTTAARSLASTTTRREPQRPGSCEAGEGRFTDINVPGPG